jgi:hypothetical protein
VRPCIFAYLEEQGLLLVGLETGGVLLFRQQEACGELSLGPGAVVGLEGLPGWDPFSPASPREGEEGPPSLLLGLAGHTAAVWRVAGGRVGPQVALVARHGTGELTCGAPARALATLFLGAASGNILAFPARLPASSAGGTQVSQYTLHGHLGGVLHLASTGLGDTLVSVGADRVAKVWRLQGRHLQPARWLALAPGLSAACLSGDSHLLLATGARLQEVLARHHWCFNIVGVNLNDKIF